MGTNHIHLFDKSCKTIAFFHFQPSKTKYMRESPLAHPAQLFSNSQCKNGVMLYTSLPIKPSCSSMTGSWAPCIFSLNPSCSPVNSAQSKFSSLHLHHLLREAHELFGAVAIAFRTLSNKTTGVSSLFKKQKQPMLWTAYFNLNLAAAVLFVAVAFWCGTDFLPAECGDCESSHSSVLAAPASLAPLFMLLVQRLWRSFAQVSNKSAVSCSSFLSCRHLCTQATHWKHRNTDTTEYSCR